LFGGDLAVDHLDPAGHEHLVADRDGVAACYAMALSAAIGQAGGTPQVLEVQADVTLGPDPAGGFRLTGIKLTVRGEGRRDWTPKPSQQPPPRPRPGARSARL
jgi:hypothetical protein